MAGCIDSAETVSYSRLSANLVRKFLSTEKSSVTSISGCDVVKGSVEGALEALLVSRGVDEAAAEVADAGFLGWVIEGMRGS
jgi:hypothetical protein